MSKKPKQETLAQVMLDVLMEKKLAFASSIIPEIFSDTDYKNRLHIDAISGVPGLGKTYWFEEKMVEQYLKWEASSRYVRHYVVYVAPTIRLLKQVKKSLSKKILARAKNSAKAEGYVRNQMRLVTAEGEDYPIQKTLNMSVEGGKTAHFTYSPLSTGGILFMTHAGFCNVESFPSIDKFVVYFDEARNCISQEKALLLTESEVLSLVNTFKITTYDGSKSIKYVKVEDAPSPRDAKTLLKSMKGMKALEGLSIILKKIANPRHSVFLYWSKPTQNDTLLRFYSIILPTHIFYGFKKVTIMSAFFRQSQMCHILKAPGLSKFPKVQFITEEVRKLSPKRSDYLGVRLNSLTIVPLRMSPKRIIPASDSYGEGIREYTDVLTVNHLTRDILAHKDDAARLVQILKECDYRNKLYTLRTVGHFRYSKDQSEGLSDSIRHVMERLDAEGLLDRICWDPIEWYAKTAYKIIKSWPHLQDKKEKPLAVLNTSLVQGLKSQSLDSFKKKFDGYEYISPKSNGMNCYMEKQTLAFLGAFNPPPDVIDFYQSIIPTYDFTSDSVIDICIQSIGRLSLRDAHSTKPNLVVVPTYDAAVLIRERFLSEYPNSEITIDTRFAKKFKMVVPKYKPYLKPTQIYAGGHTAERNRLRSKRAYLKRRLSNASKADAVRIEKQLENIRQAMDALKLQAQVRHED